MCARYLCGMFLRACACVRVFVRVCARVVCVRVRVSVCSCVRACVHTRVRARVAGLGVLGDGAQAGGEGEGVPEDDGLAAEVQEMRHILPSGARERIEGRGREVGVSKPCIGHHGLVREMRNILPYKAHRCVLSVGGYSQGDCSRIYRAHTTERRQRSGKCERSCDKGPVGGGF